MKGKNKGVQSRVLEINKRAIYIACPAHELNLALCDMSKSVPLAMTFFGVIQRLFTLFSSSTQRWSILLKYCTNLTLKPHSTTRWESRLESVKPIRYQLGNVSDALNELANTTNEPLTNSEATSLKSHIISFEFVLSLIIWYDLLHAFNIVSKLLQSEDMKLDVALNELNGLTTFLEHYRESGFAAALKTAKDLIAELDLQEEPKFAVTRKSRNKNLNANEIEDPQEHAKNIFRTTYFLAVVDVKLQQMSETDLQASCNKLADAFQDGLSQDLDRNGLFAELNIFKHTVPDKIDSALAALNYLYPIRESYPNLTIAYRLLLTIPVTVASAERSFSRLKLIINYLRSTMTEQRLNGLAILSIESEVAQEIDIEELIDNFAAKKARKVNL
ncbi:uncharacterized protein LOC116160217 [Photinus pyralis]|uniref:uncharacterized protein LOC116160217 n=1 Tax=Photinus pyralis TaxID=7054 RepID=UPI00126745C6|nr:uncharacterized protein LOC116160217 [Photinus pyralis]